MKKAKMKDFDTIWSEFKKNRDVFPHIRTDYLKRQIKNNNVIYQDGVILIVGQYKRKGTLGNVQYFKDDVIIHQILNTQKGSGKAKKVINEYFAAYQEDVDKRWGKKYPTNTFTDYGLVVGKIILSVRSANSRARRFYKKMGMSVIGNISWSKGTIGGKIYGYNVY